MVVFDEKFSSCTLFKRATLEELRSIIEDFKKDTGVELDLTRVEWDEPSVALILKVLEKHTAYVDGCIFYPPRKNAGIVILGIIVPENEFNQILKEVPKPHGVTKLEDGHMYLWW
ncbi:hypothetical protein [Thermococcus sp.]